MRPHDIIEILLQSDGPVDLEVLIDEASVHLPNRSSRWVAAFRDETGHPVWRTTGLQDRALAQDQAQKWEAEARRRQAAQPAGSRKPSGTERGIALLTQREVGLILGLSERTVREVEKQALAKLRRALSTFWREWTEGKIEEGSGRASWTLTRAEVAALYGLARTPEERLALRKMFALMQDGSR